MAIVSSFLTKKKPNFQPNFLFIVNYHLIWKPFNGFIYGSHNNSFPCNIHH